MTNKKIMVVFDALLKFINSTEYVVVPRADISSELKGEFNEEEIDSAINVLLLNDLIAKSFSDGSLVCLALTPKGIREMELREEAERQALVNEEMKKAKLMSENLPLVSEKKEENRKSKNKNKAKSDENDDDVNEYDDDDDIVEGEQAAPVSNVAVNYKRVAIVSAISAFFGALIPSAVALAIILIKVG